MIFNSNQFKKLYIYYPEQLRRESLHLRLNLQRDIRHRIYQQQMARLNEWICILFRIEYHTENDDNYISRKIIKSWEQLAYVNDIEFMIILIIRQIIHRLPHFLIQMHQGSLKLEFGKNIVRTFLKLHDVKT